MLALGSPLVTNTSFWNQASGSIDPVKCWSLLHDERKTSPFIDKGEK